MKYFVLLMLFILSISAQATNNSSSCDLKKMKWVGIPFDSNGVFDSRCKPQIIYSWIGSPETINQDDYKWPFRRKRAIFFHRTPLATSLYGSFSYRVKIKSNVSYKLVPWNEAHIKCLYPEDEKKKTVYVNQNKNGFSEYVLCSDGPVESWSFGMREHLNEMKREFNHIKKHGALNVDGFLNPNSKKYECASCFQKYTIHDARNDGSESTILGSINIMGKFSEAVRGKVFNLKDKAFYKDGPKVDEHFDTNLKLPFH
jgi:hypothetical protein